MSARASSQYVLCVSNEGYRASLLVRRVYTTVPDEQAEARGLIRVIDESGEDYLFPQALFVAIELPRPAVRALEAEPANKPLQRTAHSRRR